MNIDEEHISRLIDDEFAKISDVRLTIKKLLQLEKAFEGKDQFLIKLKQKEDELAILYKKKQINYQSLLNGHLSIGGKPGAEKLIELNGCQTDTVVTLLKTNEKGVREIETALASHGIAWIWFPLSASELRSDEEFRAEINELYRQLIEKLNLGERIFIHCAAGVHRTGSFTNGLLRKIGYTPIQSKKLIKEMRPVTAMEAVKKHWAWSENIFNAEK